MTAIAFTACTGSKTVEVETASQFSYEVDKFADLQILRYQVPGFESLSLNQNHRPLDFFS